MFSIFSNCVDKTIKQIEDRQKIKQEQLFLIEVAYDQYDKIIEKIQQSQTLTNIQSLQKTIVRSPFTYDQIRAIMESGFILNYEEQDDEINDNDDNDSEDNDKNDNQFNNTSNYSFSGQFLLSSYLLMYYYQRKQYDYKSARKLTIKYLENTTAFQAYLTKLIKNSSFIKKLTQQFDNQSKTKNQFLEKIDLYHQISNDIKGQLNNQVFIQSLLVKESKVDKALNKILPSMKNKVHPEQVETIVQSIEQYIISLSFNILLPEEIQQLLTEIKKLTFENLLKENILQEVKNILKKRQPINIDANDQGLLYEIVTFSYVSVFCEKISDTSQFIIEQFKNKTINLFEICPEQYKEVIQLVSQKLCKNIKQVQSRIVIAQITYEQIQIIIQSGYVLNFKQDEYQKVIFYDDNFLSFTLIINNNFRMNGSWDESVKQGVKYLIAKMKRKQLIKLSDDLARRKQVSTYMHPILQQMIKKMPGNIKNKFNDLTSSSSSILPFSISKLMRDNIITSFGISFISAISDIRKLINGSLNSQEFIISQIKNVSATSVEVISRVLGSTFGQPAFYAGQIIGSKMIDYAKVKLESVLPYSIVERVTIMFETYLEDLSQDILTNDEIKNIINNIKTVGMADFLKSVPEKPNEDYDFKLACKQYIKFLIVECLKKRKPINIKQSKVN